MLGQKAIRDCILNSPDLERLDLSGYWKVAEGTLEEISSVCKKLQYLNVEGCVQLTNEVHISDIAFNFNSRFCTP